MLDCDHDDTTAKGVHSAQIRIIMMILMQQDCTLCYLSELEVEVKVKAFAISIILVIGYM